MRACLAILKDSFREAVASRILTISLVSIVVVLIAIAPLGLDNAPSTQLRPYELVDVQGFLKTLNDGRTTENTPSAHVWSLMTEEQQNQVQEWLKPEDPPNADGRGRSRPGRIQFQVLEVVNRLLPMPTFYNPKNWEKVDLSDDLRPADDPGISKDKLAVRNLKRLARAFPRSIDIRDETSLSLAYGSITLYGPLRVPPTQMNRLIDETIILILSVFLGFFGVFSSLLVTATIIPRTFEPGEISLLLSKPIRRSVLFVTKFIGGCAFTFLCAALLVTGVWFLLWIRFGLWRPELLLCIPLYVFLFAIYFSVSALAGAIWRNSIVSLALVVVFWIIVTTAGAIHRFMDDVYIRSQQIAEITAAGPEVFVVDGSRNVHRWDSEKSDWVSIFEYNGGNSFQQSLQRMFGSGLRARIVATPDGERIYSLQPEFSRFGGVAPATLVSGDRENDYHREVEAASPEPVFAAFMTRDGQIILPGVRGIHKYVGVSEQVKKWQAFLKGPLGGLLPMSTSARGFEILTPKEMPTLSRDAVVAFNPSDDSLAFWDNGSLSTWNRNEDGKYSIGVQRTFEEKQSAVIATGGDFVLSALADGRVLILDRSTLETTAEGSIPKGDKPKVAEFAADGSWAVVLTHSGKVVVFSGKEKAFLRWTPRENGSVSAVSFSQDHQLIVCNGRRSLSFYPQASAAADKTLTGSTSWPFQVYDFLVLPLYKLLPKPSELDNAVRYLVTGEKSVVVESGQDGPVTSATEDLNQERVTFDLKASFLSNLGFIAVMLAAGCVYLIRKDF
jgi:hypothetical protein